MRPCRGWRPLCFLLCSRLRTDKAEAVLGVGVAAAAEGEGTGAGRGGGSCAGRGCGSASSLSSPWSWFSIVISGEGGLVSAAVSGPGLLAAAYLSWFLMYSCRSSRCSARFPLWTWTQAQRERRRMRAASRRLGSTTAATASEASPAAALASAHSPVAGSSVQPGPHPHLYRGGALYSE